MSLALPTGWAQAAGFVAVGYGLRSAAICRYDDIRVTVRLACVVPCMHLQSARFDLTVQAAAKFGSYLLAPAVVLQSFLG